MYKSWKNIRSQLDLDEIVVYDIKFENPYVKNPPDASPIERFNLYRQSDGGFDCDNSNGRSPLVGDIYDLLWGWNWAKHFRGKKMPETLNRKFGSMWTRMGGDTMNSFKTTYNQAYKLYNKDQAKILSYKKLQDYANLTHTIGNFCLVPFHLKEGDSRSFNVNRGFGKGKSNPYFVYDFFDLSLKIIEETIGRENFKTYIDTFLLNDFVEEDYSIKPLFTRHKTYLNPKNKIDTSKPDDFLPENLEELDEFLTRVNRCIKLRGYRMVKALDDLSK